MVAYSFKERFAEPITSGTKRQTIRAERKRHARPGEVLQLYQGMRTRHCRLILRAQCLDVKPIRIDLVEQTVTAGIECINTRKALDAFARRDGFSDWDDMHDFWMIEHSGKETFSGVLITWTDAA
jgi:uncharacterized protein YqfB (UPF0267 family)